MSVIKWDVRFYTGLPELDQQHNRLVGLVNRLGEVCYQTPEVLDQAFQELAVYVTEHFSLEDRMMEEASLDVDHVEDHRNAHTLFVATLLDLWDDRNKGSDQTLVDLLDFLRDWTLTHILQKDREMALAVQNSLGADAPHNMFTHF